MSFSCFKVIPLSWIGTFLKPKAFCIKKEPKDCFSPQIWMKKRWSVVRLRKVLDWQNFHFTLRPHRPVILKAGLFVGGWILRLRLQLRAEWPVGGSAGISESFISEWPSIRLSGALCMGDLLMLYVVIWIVDVPIGYIDWGCLYLAKMKLWVLALVWSWSCWLLIDMCIAFWNDAVLYVYNRCSL